MDTVLKIPRPVRIIGLAAFGLYVLSRVITTGTSIHWDFDWVLELVLFAIFVEVGRRKVLPRIYAHYRKIQSMDRALVSTCLIALAIWIGFDLIALGFAPSSALHTLVGIDAIGPLYRLFEALTGIWPYGSLGRLIGLP